jgi:hypothetical protein
MMASSSTVLSNLAYLIGAVVLAIVGGLAVWLHHRQPKSVDANMASFRRGLNALAPDPQPGQAGGARNPQGFRIQSEPIELTHVRVERTGAHHRGTAPRKDPNGEVPAPDVASLEGGGESG